MFQSRFFTYFIRKLVKTTNKKNFFINNSMLYNKTINNKNFKSENKRIKNSTSKPKRIEFHESHSSYSYIIEKFNN
jgi:hypothetical protein